MNKSIELINKYESDLLKTIALYNRSKQKTIKTDIAFSVRLDTVREIKKILEDGK